MVFGSILPVVASSAATTKHRNPSCDALTMKLVKSDGFTKATGPKITMYNYTNAKKNATNALGETIDYGAKALVISCLSPQDIRQLSIQAQGKTKPTMTATQYMAYMVKQSQGAMTKTTLGGVDDYLDRGNGKEDGLGSTAKLGSVRLDAWIAGKYIVLAQSAPTDGVAAPAKIVKFIASTLKVLK
jgi:hypothetical protein